MNKKLYRIILMFVLFFSIFLTFTINVFAANNCPLCGSASHYPGDGTLTTMEGWVYDMNCKVYGGDIFNDDTGEVLRFNVQGTKFSSLWQQGRVLYNGFSKLGIILLCVYVIYDLMTKSAGDNLTPENFLQGLMKLLVGYMIISAGYDFVGAAAEFTTNIFNAISPSSGNIHVFQNKCNYQEVIDANNFQNALDASILFFPWLIMLLAGAILNVTCWMRVLDIMIRVIFAPIGMSDIVNDGTKSAGFRYFKKLVASLLQGAVIVAIIKSYNILMPVVSQMSGLAEWGMSIIISFVLIGTIFKASSISNQIIG